MGGRATHSLVKRLRSVPDFAALDDRTLLRVVGASANLFWRSGSLVFDAGTPAEALFIVISGRVRIFDVVDGVTVTVAEVGPDGFFGELALLEGAAHSKGAEAADDTELMVVRREWFEALLESDPELAGYFRRLFEERRKAFTAPGTPGGGAP